MNEITLHHGRILIPQHLVTNTTKFKFRGLKYAGARKGYWYIYASQANINLVKTMYHVDLQPSLDLDIMANQITYKTIPRPYQLEAAKLGIPREGFGYLLDPGLGKTKIAIDDAQTHIFTKDINRVLVICTKSMVGTWVDEIKKHGYWNDWEIERWPDGMIRDNIDAPSARWLVMNVDALNFPNSYEKAFLFAISGETMMIVDESTTIKNIDASRTEAAMKIRQQCKYRRILTGTPIANTPMDLYSQLYFLDPEIVYGWSFPTFRNHFCVMGGYRNKQIMGYINQDELARIVASCTYKADKTTVTDLPEKIYQQRYIIMSDKARRKYQEIVNQILVDLPGPDDTTTITKVQHAITKMVKLRQITGGMILDDTGYASIISKEKLDELDLLLDDGTGSVIIWVQFRHELEAVSVLLTNKNIEHVTLSGVDTAQERDFIIKRFEEGGVQAIVVQNDTGSEGITLNAAHTSIFFTNSLSHKTRVQAEDRCHRIGQTKSVTYIDLLVSNSIDVSVYNLLKNKKNVADVIMNAALAHQGELVKRVLMGDTDAAEGTR